MKHALTIHTNALRPIVIPYPTALEAYGQAKARNDAMGWPCACAVAAESGAKVWEEAWKHHSAIFGKTNR